MEKRGPKKAKGFTRGHVIKGGWHMAKEFDKIPTHRLIPFIANVQTREDFRILKLWEDHFRGLFQGVQTRYKVPFAVTEDPKTLVKNLWKEVV